MAEKKEEELLKPENISENDWDVFVDVMTKKEQLKGETSERQNDYDFLELFAQGNHWGGTGQEGSRSVDPPEGAVKVTINYCGLFVKKHAAKILGTATQKALDVDVQPPPWQGFLTDEDDEAQIEDLQKENAIKMAHDMAQHNEDIIRKIWENNNAQQQWEEAAEGGSEFGDIFIKGPWRDPASKEIRFQYIEDPGSISPAFSGSDYNKIIYYFHSYKMTKEAIMEVWGDKIKENGIELGEGTPEGEETHVPMFQIHEYWDKDKFVVVIQNQLVDNNKHGFGFVPLTYIKNLYKPREPFGQSDIEDVIEPQKEYNERLSSLATFFSTSSSPKYKGWNLPPDYIKKIKPGRSQVLPLKRTQRFEQDIVPLTNAIQTWPDIRFLSKLLDDMLAAASLTQMDLGGPGQSTPSGYALEVRSQSSIERVNSKRRRWNTGLAELNARILQLVEKYEPKAKEIINGYYENKIIFPSILPKSATDELNKLQGRSQSLKTTLKNLGVQNPENEIEEIKAEIADKILGPELVRNYIAWEKRQMMQNPQDFPPEPGQEPQQGQAPQGESPAPSPMTRENQPDQQPQPMAQPGVVGGSLLQSPAGRIRQAQQRGE